MLANPLLGVLIERRLARPRPTLLAGRSHAFAAALVAPALYVVFVAAGLREALVEGTEAAVGPALFHLLAHSRHFLWDWIVAALFAVHLLAVARLLPKEAAGARVRSWFAGATFSLYLTHFPVLVFAYAAARHAGYDIPAVACVAVAVVVAFVFAEAFERPLPALRRRLRARADDMRRH